MILVIPALLIWFNRWEGWCCFLNRLISNSDWCDFLWQFAANSPQTSQTCVYLVRSARFSTFTRVITRMILWNRCQRWWVSIEEVSTDDVREISPLGHGASEFADLCIRDFSPSVVEPIFVYFTNEVYQFQPNSNEFVIVFGIECLWDRNRANLIETSECPENEIMKRQSRKMDYSMT